MEQAHAQKLECKNLLLLDIIYNKLEVIWNLTEVDSVEIVVKFLYLHFFSIIGSFKPEYLCGQLEVTPAKHE